MSAQKIVVCGTGFLGSYIVKELAKTAGNVVHVASRNPEPAYKRIQADLKSQGKEDLIQNLGEPLYLDVTKPETLEKAFKGSDAVVSLVGVLQGTRETFEKIQWKGAVNVAKICHEEKSKLIHISAIGADTNRTLPYFNTKGLAERGILSIHPKSAIIRPSLVFGPGDGFFARFATLSKFMPFLPVFGGGITQFQPVYAGDIASFIRLSLTEPNWEKVEGRVFEAGGPNVFSYRELMRQVLVYSKRWRPIISLPFFVGKAQGLVFEQLPENILSISRDQVEQLKMDNVAFPNSFKLHQGVEVEHGPGFSALLSEVGKQNLTSIHKILPKYL